MVIEERELHYPPDSPLRAWRLFRVRAFDADVVLSSPMYHDPDLPDSCWPDEVALDTAKRVLHQRYGVPVSGLDSVPAWVTGNQRDAGRPPDDVNLDLDLDRLDLRDVAHRDGARNTEYL
jgi:hypothetical protein